MKQKSYTLAYVVLIAGLALIFSGFFLLVPEEKRNSIFWLDISTACFVFIVIAITELGFFGINFNIERQVSELGIRFVYVRLYSLLAVTVIVAGYFYGVDFRYQLFFQLLMVFVLLVGYFFSNLSSDKSTSVQMAQEIQRKGKDEILNALNQFEILLIGDSGSWASEKRKIYALKEDARYISPSNSKSAMDLDLQITSTIQQAYEMAKKNNQENIEVFALLNKCEELLKLRKSKY